MSGSGYSAPLRDLEYDAIESAIGETARGRWFLEEFARRHRAADTSALLEAVERLERVIAGRRIPTELDRIRFDLVEMAEAIAHTRTDVAALRGTGQPNGALVAASEALDDIVHTTEQATSQILDAAEHVQEVAWALREAGGDDRRCDELDRQAAAIYTACSFRDLTAQRTRKVVQTLRYLEARIYGLIDTWDHAEVATDAPLTPAPGLSQSDVDALVAPTADNGAPAENPGEAENGGPAPESSRLPAPPASDSAEMQDLFDALASIDALTARDKLNRFT